jgi:hypothetical protein
MNNIKIIAHCHDLDTRHKLNLFLRQNFLRLLQFPGPSYIYIRYLTRSIPKRGLPPFYPKITYRTLQKIFPGKNFKVKPQSAQ